MRFGQAPARMGAADGQEIEDTRKCPGERQDGSRSVAVPIDPLFARVESFSGERSEGIL
jgi:hypothetical protein